MWAKAGKLCTSPGAIQCAPCHEENAPATPVYLVFSGSNSRKFHSVECSGTLPAVVKCLSEGMKSSGICSHALAVCEKVGLHSVFAVLQY